MIIKSVAEYLHNQKKTPNFATQKRNDGAIAQ